MLMEMNAVKQAENFTIWGEVNLEDKEVGSLRLMSQNQDGFKLSMEGTEQHGLVGKTMEQLMMSWKVREVDVMMLQETHWEDPKCVTQPSLYIGGKAADALRRNWGGDKARVVTAQGHRSKKGWNGGVALGTGEELKPFMGRKEVDSRGWGRYVIVEMVGVNGNKLGLVTWYAPSRDGAM